MAANTVSREQRHKSGLPKNRQLAGKRCAAEHLLYIGIEQRGSTVRCPTGHSFDQPGSDRPISARQRQTLQCVTAAHPWQLNANFRKKVLTALF
jgi:hypothetical protein